MTAHNNFDDDENLEIIALLASLDVADARQTHPPRTPSPNQPPPYALDYHISPAARPRTLPSSPPSSLTIYRYTTPTRIGYTPDWSALHTIAFQLDIFHRSVAGSATQGVPNTKVLAVQRGSGQKKGKRVRKAAYVVFCGRSPGVYLTWCAPSVSVFFFFLSINISQVGNGKARFRCPQLHFSRLRHRFRSESRLRLRLCPFMDTLY